MKKQKDFKLYFLTTEYYDFLKEIGQVQSKLKRPYIGFVDAVNDEFLYLIPSTSKSQNYKKFHKYSVPTYINKKMSSVLLINKMIPVKNNEKYIREINFKESNKYWKSIALKQLKYINQEDVKSKILDLALEAREMKDPRLKFNINFSLAEKKAKSFSKRLNIKNTESKIMNKKIKKINQEEKDSISYQEYKALDLELKGALRQGANFEFDPKNPEKKLSKVNKKIREIEYAFKTVSPNYSADWKSGILSPTGRVLKQHKQKYEELNEELNHLKNSLPELEKHAKKYVPFADMKQIEKEIANKFGHDIQGLLSQLNDFPTFIERLNENNPSKQVIVDKEGYEELQRYSKTLPEEEYKKMNIKWEYSQKLINEVNEMNKSNQAEELSLNGFKISDSEIISNFEKINSLKKEMEEMYEYLSVNHTDGYLEEKLIKDGILIKTEDKGYTYFDFKENISIKELRGAVWEADGSYYQSFSLDEDGFFVHKGFSPQEHGKWKKWEATEEFKKGSDDLDELDDFEQKYQNEYLKILSKPKKEYPLNKKLKEEEKAVLNNQEKEINMAQPLNNKNTTEKQEFKQITKITKSFSIFLSSKNVKKTSAPQPDGSSSTLVSIPSMGLTWLPTQTIHEFSAKSSKGEEIQKVAIPFDEERLYTFYNKIKTDKLDPEGNSIYEEQKQKLKGVELFKQLETKTKNKEIYVGLKKNEDYVKTLNIPVQSQIKKKVKTA